jgi:hypothetical protein
MSHKIQKTLRISKPKYRKSIDLDDLITEQICVDDEHTMNKLAQSIQMLDTVVENTIVENTIVEDTIVEEPPPKMSKIVRSIKMSNLLLEEDLCSKDENKDTDSTDDSKDTDSTHNVCLQDLCLQDVCLQDLCLQDVCLQEDEDDEEDDDSCDHEVCFREVTIMNITGANGKKPTYKITNSCRCPRLSLC